PQSGIASRASPACVTDRAVGSMNCGHSFVLDLSAVNPPAQWDTDCQDEEDQHPNLEAEVTPPGARDPIESISHISSLSGSVGKPAGPSQFGRITGSRFLSAIHHRRSPFADRLRTDGESSGSPTGRERFTVA